MDTIIMEMRDKLHALDNERTAIHETAGKADLNASQQARWDAIETEQDELRKDLADAEERAARAERVNESRARWGSLQVGDSVERSREYHAAEVSRMGSMEVRDTARRVVDKAKHLRSEQGDRLSEMLEGPRFDQNLDRDYLARRTVITESASYRSAFMQLMSNPMPVLAAAEADAIRSLQQFDSERAMSIGTANAGGYGVPVTIDPTIILTGQGSPNPFFDIARVETITTDRWKGVSSNGSTWSWDAEATEVSDDSPTLAQPVVPVHMAKGFIPFSIELGQDYPNIAGELAMLLAEGYGELTAEAFAVGTGSAQPKGIFTALDADTNVEVVVTTDGAFGKADISKVWTALPDRAKPNATWLMSEDVKEEVRGFGTDEYATQVVTLQEAEFRLRERRVVASGFAPAFTGSTSAANILVVGDFRKFVIAQRAGMNLELIPHLVGTTNNRPTGQRGFFAWARVGSDVVDIRAFRLLQNQ